MDKKHLLRNDFKRISYKYIVQLTRYCSSKLSVFDVVDQSLLDEIKMECIRMIAHVDHGKSTLSDSLLQMTGNISDNQRKRGQVLDTLKVERERGITVKAQTASMIYDDLRTSRRYLLNLIDTPGHIDFSYEVSRSLASCQGALLLVDSTQNIQAQTLANYEKAKKLGLELIPIVTKIDLPNAQPEDTALTMGTTFNIDPDSVIMTSAKKMIGIRDVLEAIIDRLPPPSISSDSLSGRWKLQKKPSHLNHNNNRNNNSISNIGSNSSDSFGIIDSDEDSKGTVLDQNQYYPFKGRIVDSWFDEHRGVVCLIQNVIGTLKEGQRISTFASVQEAKDIDSRTDFSVQEIGLLTPSQLRTTTLKTGQVGYVVAGLRSTRQARIGDTMYIPSEWVRPEDMVPLSGYESAKPMLFASIFPVDSGELEALFAAVDRLCLNDSSISVARDHSSSLGSGLRCGFLGFLHMEVFNQRLSDEFEMDIVMTTPSVPYIIRYPDGSSEEVCSVSNWPESGRNNLTYEILEPVVRVLLITPQEYYGNMTEIIKEKRGSDLDITPLDDGQVRIVCIVPWQEVVSDMNDLIKNASSGYASFNYEEAGYISSDLVKVEIAVNGEPCDPLSFISHRSKAISSGRNIVEKLKDVIERQQFEIILQAKIGSKVLAKERLAPYRKDVLSKGGKTVGGGDITRKQKLLAKQREGKKRAKMIGKVEISQDAFWTVLKR